jgi:hypothetical protein
VNRLPLLAIAALACLLAVTILLEYRGAERRVVLGAPVVPAHVAPAAHGRAPVQGVAASAASLEVWSRTILDRPLFSPSRRPGRAAVASTELPRLAGIIIGPGGNRAIFASAGDTRAVVVGAGAHAGPYLIRAVGLTGVSVTGPNGPELLRPVYDHSAARGTAEPLPGAAPPSILDLLRSRVQNGGGLAPNLLPAPTFQKSPPVRN